jgi:hypothetical protein
MLPIVCSALLGVVFCLDFGPFFFSSLVLLLGVFLSFIYLFIFQTFVCRQAVHSMGWG